MTARRVLVTGAGGQVGRDLTDVLAGSSVPGGLASATARTGEFDVLALTRNDLDVTNEEAVRRALDASRPDVVVNLAAYTGVDRAEHDAAACRATNTDAVRYLSGACHERGAHLVTISTDYVFDGTKGAAYVEDDVTNPINVYGQTKLDGELACAPEDTIIRTSWVMGARGRNVARLVLEKVRRNDHVRFVRDQLGSPTFAADLARALIDAVRERPGGTWHVTNAGNATWYDVARETARLAGTSESLVTAILTSELVVAPLARRPARSDLTTNKWLERGLWEMPHWLEALQRLVADC